RTSCRPRRAGRARVARWRRLAGTPRPPARRRRSDRRGARGTPRWRRTGQQRTAPETRGCRAPFRFDVWSSWGYSNTAPTSRGYETTSCAPAGGALVKETSTGEPVVLTQPVDSRLVV